MGWCIGVPERDRTYFRAPNLVEAGPTQYRNRHWSEFEQLEAILTKLGLVLAARGWPNCGSLCSGPTASIGRLRRRKSSYSAMLDLNTLCILEPTPCQFGEIPKTQVLRALKRCPKTARAAHLDQFQCDLCRNWPRFVWAFRASISKVRLSSSQSGRFRGTKQVSKPVKFGPVLADTWPNVASYGRFRVESQQAAFA